MNNKLKFIYDLMRQDKYFEALKLIEEIEAESMLYPLIYVLKGLCIYQLDDDIYELSDIEELYKNALKIDDEFVSALLELGHHYYAINNDSLKAIPYFEKSIRILKDLTMDAVSGLSKCIEETQDPKKAIEFLEDVKNNIIDQDVIENLINEFRE